MRMITGAASRSTPEAELDKEAGQDKGPEGKLRAFAGETALRYGGLSAMPFECLFAAATYVGGGEGQKAAGRLSWSVTRR